jgi:hypothetical protein
MKSKQRTKKMKWDVCIKYSTETSSGGSFLTIFRNTINCDSKGIFVMPRENQQQQQRKWFHKQIW